MNSFYESKKILIFENWNSIIDTNYGVEFRYGIPAASKNEIENGESDYGIKEKAGDRYERYPASRDAGA
jgi:hypothetical protein